MHLSRRLIAELIGTFGLVLDCSGGALLAANFAGPVHGLGIGFIGVSLAPTPVRLAGARGLRVRCWPGPWWPRC
jgi:aquaporin Z